MREDIAPARVLDVAVAPPAKLGPLTLRHELAGNLRITSGRITVFDPYGSGPPLERTFPAGTFPVLLTIARIEKKKGELVAFATIRFTPAAIAEWQPLADTDGYQYFPVDSANAAFADADGCKQWNDEFDYEAFEEAMEKRRRVKWSSAEYDLGDHNVIAFSSGFGDSMYRYYAGLTAAGDIAALTVSFDVIRDEDLA